MKTNLLTPEARAQDAQRHREQIAKWCVLHKFPAPTGPVVDAFVTAMEGRQYGVEETWDAWVWFRDGFQHGALYWNSITIRPIILMAGGEM